MRSKLGKLIFFDRGLIYMIKKKISVLHGMTEVAGQGYYSVKGIKETGFFATMAVFRKNSLGYPVDVDLKISLNLFKLSWEGMKVLFLFFTSLFKYSIFHFHSGRSILPFCIDVPIFKLFRKMVFIELHGSEVRWKFNRNPKDPNSFASLYGLPNYSKITLMKFKFLMRFADIIILHDKELFDHLPASINNKVRYIPLRIDLDRFKPIYPDPNKKRITIVHAPSKRSLKGTEFVIKAVENLQKSFDIEFILVENMDNDSAISVYQSADIIIDQLLIGSYGVFACEAMALGKPVITYISEYMKKVFPKNLPIVSANYLNIEEVLSELIIDGELRKKLGIQGRTYVENFHDYRKIGQVLTTLYLNPEIQHTHEETFHTVKQKELAKEMIIS